MCNQSYSRFEIRVLELSPAAECNHRSFLIWLAFKIHKPATPTAKGMKFNGIFKRLTASYRHQLVWGPISDVLSKVNECQVCLQTSRIPCSLLCFSFMCEVWVSIQRIDNFEQRQLEQWCLKAILPAPLELNGFIMVVCTV